MTILSKIEQALARRSLEHYSEAILGFKPAKHHMVLIDKLELVANGALKRLMVIMPPGYAKSTYASVAFPGYLIGNNPDKNIICASHAKDLARSFSRKVRNVVGSGSYYDIFDLKLAKDSRSTEVWQVTDADGNDAAEFYAVGVDSSVTGKRADGAIIDDPVKGRKQAESALIRDMSWEWYRSDLRTRLKPGAFIILIQTRWHEDDMAGRILPKEYAGESGYINARDGEEWYVLNLPAIAREGDPMGRLPGEYLWPEWYTPKMVDQEKLTQGIRNWNSLFQGLPIPEEGYFFLKDWFKWYDKIPPNLTYYGASDYAVTSNGGDFTVHIIIGLDKEDNIYVVDLWRGQTDSNIWMDAYIGLVKRWRPIEWGVEQGQINRSIGPFIDKKEVEAGTYCYRKPFSSATDKSSRCQAIRGRMAQGKVYFPRDADWMGIMQAEMLSFPSGKYDDIVDTLGMFGRMLSEMYAYDESSSKKSVIDFDVFSGLELQRKQGSAFDVFNDINFNVFGE